MILTFGKLKQLIAKYTIPDNVRMLSDSGWECCETDMDRIYYSEQENVIVFTQSFHPYDTYQEEPGWTPLYEENEEGYE